MEINLLQDLPQSPRPIAERARRKREHPEVIALARQFGREYFDGDRVTCYGGYLYDGRWRAVARRMRDHYGIQAGWRVADIGAAKGFLLHDLRVLVPGVKVSGLDISHYAVDHAMPDVQPYITVGNANNLPWWDGAFDLAVSINTLHNLPLPECRRAIRELMRVSSRQYLQVDSWRNDQERRNLLDWAMTAETFLGQEEWRALLAELGYKGDWYFTFIEGERCSPGS